MILENKNEMMEVNHQFVQAMRSTWTETAVFWFLFAKTIIDIVAILDISFMIQTQTK